MEDNIMKTNLCYAYW